MSRSQNSNLPRGAESSLYGACAGMAVAGTSALYLTSGPSSQAREFNVTRKELTDQVQDLENASEKLVTIKLPKELLQPSQRYIQKEKQELSVAIATHDQAKPPHYAVGEASGPIIVGSLMLPLMAGLIAARQFLK